jgi:SAM-dependent methyltransferase
MTVIEHCPVCGSPERTPVCRVPDERAAAALGFLVVRCRGCGSGYVAEGPDPRDLPGYYPASYAGYGAGSSLSAHVLTRLLSLVLQQEIGSNLGLPLLDPAAGANRLLDVGIGGGSLAWQLEARGWSIVGLDFTPALARAGPLRGIRLTVGDATRTPFRDGSFDLVLASHVLEHLYDPIRALTEYRRLLRPSGRLVIGVPNFDSYPSRAFDRATHAFLDVPRHLVFFTPASLGSAIAKAGLTVVECHTVPFPALLPTTLLKIGVDPRAIAAGLPRAVVSSVSLPLDLLTQAGGKGCNLVATAVRQ